jgi:hypothetical protein
MEEPRDLGVHMPRKKAMKRAKKSAKLNSPMKSGGIKRGKK